MPSLTQLAARAERHIGPLVSTVLRLRPRTPIQPEAIDPEQKRRVRNSWWGADERWYAGGTPPRQHNRITPLVDGDAFFRRLYSALTEARQYVYITAWCLTPYVPLIRDTHQDLVDTRLLEVLSKTAERIPVRILLWGGAPAVIQPTRSVVNATLQTIRSESHGDLRCEADNTAKLSHCHHQKAIVIDGRMAFVGGMDLTTFAGDRWDLDGHGLRASVNWHDVVVLVEGEAVADVEENFRQRWSAVTGDHGLPHVDPEVDAAWTTPVQVVRTIPRKTYPFANDGEYGIHHSYLQAIKHAKRLIYLETQYLWSPEITDALIEAVNQPRTETFRIIIVLPARATSGKWDNDQHVEKLRDADRGRGIVEIYTLYSSGPAAGLTAFKYRPTYVHAKVGLIDDEWLTVGSANLNDRGLITDGELNVTAADAGLAERLRCKLWAEHLSLSEAEIKSADPVQLIDEVWKQEARRNADTIRRSNMPLSSHVHRYEPGRMPGAWLLDETEALTFEH
ncbi:MAG: phospholipase D family protein [Chloroflexota bacterium]|nr:phospholipase D family protein [Chloroflexota bacterium]